MVIEIGNFKRMRTTPTDRRTDITGYRGASAHLEKALLCLQKSDKRTDVTYLITTTERTGCSIEKSDVVAA